MAIECSRSNAGSDPHASNQEAYTLLTHIRSRFVDAGDRLRYRYRGLHSWHGRKLFSTLAMLVPFGMYRKELSFVLSRPSDLLQNYEKPLFHLENP